MSRAFLSFRKKPITASISFPLSSSSCSSLFNKTQNKPEKERKQEMKNIKRLAFPTLFIILPILLSLFLIPENDITSLLPSHHHPQEDSATSNSTTDVGDGEDDGDEFSGTKFSVFLMPFDEDRDENVYLGSDQGLEYDFYKDSCPQAEEIIRNAVARMYSNHHNITAGLLRLLFHDCFIKGCDASVFLNDTNGDENNLIEKQAIPNLTLKGFDEIGKVKDELEQACPGVVSCADTLAIATRDAILRAGGPYYPVFTGRRDSDESYYDDAMTDIPKPTDDINRTLKLFSVRGFNERETVGLLGGHNIGKINCDFIQSRLDNFNDTGKPDPTVSSNFSDEIRHNCLNRSGNNHAKNFFQGLSASVLSGRHLDAHYYQNLLRGRGLLYSDQQLMADESTASLVRLFASDDGSLFRKDFARVMVKMSNLGVLTGIRGQVRTLCNASANAS